MKDYEVEELTNKRKYIEDEPVVCPYCGGVGTIHTIIGNTYRKSDCPTCEGMGVIDER